jgi:DNA-directed RNA polymerase subunit RPC12/RpoP
MEHKCLKCNKNYASYKSLWNHNAKFHKSECNENVKKSQIDVKKMSIKKMDIIETVSYSCINCKKPFKSRQGKWVHEKTCNNIKEDKIDIVMKAPMNALTERPAYNIGRIGHSSGIIELEKHHFLTAKGYQYSPDYLFYIILFLACEKGVINQVISERMTLEYYKTTGRPLLEILHGYTWMSSITSNAVFIQRFRIALEFIEKHKQEVEETK